jgi:hypothetical protein
MSKSSTMWVRGEVLKVGKLVGSGYTVMKHYQAFWKLEMRLKENETPRTTQVFSLRD